VDEVDEVGGADRTVVGVADAAAVPAVAVSRIEAEEQVAVALQAVQVVAAEAVAAAADPTDAVAVGDSRTRPS
jgi:hypothetical protein